MSAGVEHSCYLMTDIGVRATFAAQVAELQQWRHHHQVMVQRGVKPSFTVVSQAQLGEVGVTGVVDLVDIPATRSGLSKGGEEGRDKEVKHKQKNAHGKREGPTETGNSPWYGEGSKAGITNKQEVG